LDEKSNIVLADYGWMSHTKKSNNMVPATNLDFIAPEILMNKPASKKSDIWSIGTVLYTIAFKKMPFDGFSLQEKIKSMMHGEIATFDRVDGTSPDKSIELSVNFKALVGRMLNPNPDDRPEIEEIYSSTWFAHYLTALNINLGKYRTKKGSTASSTDKSRSSSYTSYSRTSELSERSSSKGSFQAMKPNQGTKPLMDESLKKPSVGILGRANFIESRFIETSPTKTPTKQEVFPSMKTPERISTTSLAIQEEKRQDDEPVQYYTRMSRNKTS
jgi:serine/threonine protein kinase